MGSVGGDRSWLLLGGLALGGLLQPYLGCLGVPEPEGEGPVDAQTSDLIGDLEAEVMVPSLTTFRDRAAVLSEALDAWAAGGDRDEVRPAFLDAMAAWQVVEAMPIGPLGSSLTDLGGQDLRDEIYSWPSVNPCRVDQVTASGDYAAADFVEANLVNAYGLDALEHLLYAPDGENVCPSQVDINAQGTWAALGAEGVDAARAAYAQVVLADVLARTDEVLAAWDPDGGAFADELRAAGTADAQEAVFHGMLYVELVVKDQKLAGPLAGGVPEGEVSGRSAASVVANLQGLRLLFTGGEGVGFDDLLADEGYADVSDQVLAAVDAAEAVAETEGLGQPLYDAVKALTDLLKGDVLTILALELPSEAAGDND